MSNSEQLNYHLSHVAKEMGVDTSEMTIVQMRTGTDERHRELELVQGSWDDRHPWVIVDENNYYYTLSSTQSFSNIMRLFALSQNENFQLKLEKAILEHYPIDFQDVWTVAIDKIRELAQSRGDSNIVNLNLDWLISEIKQKYPNLFYHVGELLAQTNEP